MSPQSLDASTGHNEQLVDAGEFLRLSGWSPEHLAKAIQRPCLICVEHEGRQLIPVFFADPQLDRRHIEAVCKTLADLPSGSQWQFFRTPKGSLGGLRPLQALRLGQYAAVLRAAEGFATR